MVFLAYLFKPFDLLLQILTSFRKVVHIVLLKLKVFYDIMPITGREILSEVYQIAGVAERSIAPDCKSGGLTAYIGSNPVSST